MKFADYREHFARVLQSDGAGGIATRYETIDTRQMNSLVLAYMGDAWYHLYVREHLLSYEQAQVHALHDIAAEIVSARRQARAYRAIEAQLSEEEQAIYRRGRNHKSHASRAASEADYHASTGFEALLGTLYLDGEAARLEEISGAAFRHSLAAIMREEQEKNQ